MNKHLKSNFAQKANLKMTSATLMNRILTNKMTLLLVALFFLGTSSLSAQRTSYVFKVKTADKYLAGTDNDIKINLFAKDNRDRSKLNLWEQRVFDSGMSGEKTGWFRIEGDKERNDSDEFTKSLKNIGELHGILIDVVGDLSDKWYCEYIEVHVNGYKYEFEVNKELSYDPEFFKVSSTDFETPIKIEAVGAPNSNNEIKYYVGFANNLGGNRERPLNSLSITATDIHEIGWSETESTKKSAQASISGSFMGNGVTLTGEWAETFSKTKTETKTHIESVSQNFSILVGPNSVALNKVKMTVPYNYQQYQYGDKIRTLRSIAGKVNVSEAVMDIPKMVNGKVEAIAWSIIENDYLEFADPEVKKDVTALKGRFIASGWVYEGDKPTPPKTTTTTSPNTNTPYNQSETTLGLTWQKKGARNVVMAGRDTDGKDLGVCRIMYDGFYHSGKERDGSCFIGRGRKEIIKNDYQVLTNPNGIDLSWVTPSSSVLNKAPISGNSRYGKLYVGRHKYGRSTQPGRLMQHQGKPTVFYGYGGAEKLAKTNIEMLVVGRQSAPPATVPAPTPTPTPTTNTPKEVAKYPVSSGNSDLVWAPKGTRSAVVGGVEGRNKLVVCRCIHNGVQYSGKVVGNNCNVASGSKEFYTSDFEILVNKTGVNELWTTLKNNRMPREAVRAGKDVDGTIYYVGRVTRRDGSKHPGKVSEYRNQYTCEYGYGGRKYTDNQFEILVSQQKQTQGTGSTRNTTTSTRRTTTSTPPRNTTPRNTSTPPRSNSNNSSAGELVWAPKGDSGAMIGGNAKGSDFEICRCKYREVYHSGKVIDGKCHIGRNRKEITKDDYEVLTNPRGLTTKWVKPSRSQIKKAVVAGTSRYGKFYVARHTRSNGSIHPGRALVNGSKVKVFYGFFGKEIGTTNNIEILIVE